MGSRLNKVRIIEYREVSPESGKAAKEMESEKAKKGRNSPGRTERVGAWLAHRKGDKGKKEYRLGDH